MLISADRLLLPDADDPAPGWLDVAADRIRAAGTGMPPRPADERLTGLVVPGYVDVHSHGGGGASFVTEDPDAARRVLAAHRAAGTTTMVASLVTGAVPDLVRQVSALAGLVDSGELAGIHLEGPWLAAGHAGAHPRRLLCDPAPEVVDEMLAAGRGGVRLVTVAPERAGALEAISRLTARGVTVAIGHTAAGYDLTRRAIEAGARGATHLFNAMAPLHHRRPGPALALWEDPRVTLEIILDGVHVRPELASFVWRTAPGRVAFVTDAMAAAGAPDGDYVLGEVDVQVRGRIATVAGTDTIAGSTLTLDRAVRNAAAAGIPLAAAIRAATAIPADYLGLTDVGRLAAGRYADVIVLDGDLRVTRVLRRGRWEA
ncbi:N-acetylglucosamine-6-phosphate deacetylase [Propionicicella superfundia]|uniref:N-acetylglucosamine-6-phosphate deacetylase n=1 Tax=Propionicicella superfundia TaxID=348582 RepID=UPI0003F855A9|nr:amidohydrolase family protein [Propionicicella superfundia]